MKTLPPSGIFLHGRVAQLAEHSALNRQVVGSIPTASTKELITYGRQRRRHFQALRRAVQWRYRFQCGRLGWERPDCARRLSRKWKAGHYCDWFPNTQRLYPLHPLWQRGGHFCQPATRVNNERELYREPWRGRATSGLSLSCSVRYGREPGYLHLCGRWSQGTHRGRRTSNEC